MSTQTGGGQKIKSNAQTLASFLASKQDALMHPEQFENFPLTSELAREALVILCKKGHRYSCRDLILRCRHRDWAEDLLGVVAQEMKKQYRYYELKLAINGLASSEKAFFSAPLIAEILGAQDA